MRSSFSRRSFGAGGQRGGLLVFALAVLLFHLPAKAEESVVATQALSGDELVLQDERSLRLLGIKAAMPEAKSFLESHLLGKPLLLQNETTDRYGRVTGVVFDAGDTMSVQERLLSEGWAFVYPATENEGIDLLFAAENAARAQKRGLWATSFVLSAKDAPSHRGQYALVVGDVAKTERIKNKVYLSLGAEEPPAFTLVIAAKHLRTLKKNGFDPLSSKGKTICVRGWITDDRGAAITITDPHQIEADAFSWPGASKKGARAHKAARPD